MSHGDRQITRSLHRLFARREWQKYYNVRMCNVACRSANIFNRLGCFDTLQVRNCSNNAWQMVYCGENL